MRVANEFRQARKNARNLRLLITEDERTNAARGLSFPTLTLRSVPSSISQEPGMATMGLALPWKARIASVPRQRETRVEPSEHFAGGPNPAVVNAITEDAALAAGCRAGDLQTYERLYSIHGARMRNLGQSSRESRGCGRCGAGDVPKSAAKYCEFSRAIKFYHLDLSHSDQHLLRRAP